MRLKPSALPAELQECSSGSHLEAAVPVLRVPEMLAAGIPISLLVDLSEPEGPDSVAINAVERPPGDPIWLEAADQRCWREFILHVG
jgi:hypothetical protein